MELTTREEGQLDINNDRMIGPFDAVKAQYVAAVSRQMKRRNRQKRDFFTRDEQRAIEFYGRAVQQIEAL
jgi:hypothetical protein